MNELTSAQIKVIETWTEKRDALLREIGILETQLSELKKITIEEGQASTDLQRQISESKGRLIEIQAIEERTKNSLSIEVAELIAQKSRLESECEAKKSEIKASEEEEKRIISSIAILCEAHDKMSDQSKIVDEVVGQVIERSSQHASDIQILTVETKKVFDEMIEKGNKNITQTNIVLEKLPRYIFELQKPIPIRRAYSVQRGTVIEPENKEIKP